MQADDLEKDSIRTCALALRDAGFRQKRRGELLQPHPGGSRGWLGLNLLTEGMPEKLSVNPVVGVRHMASRRPRWSSAVTKR